MTQRYFARAGGLVLGIVFLLFAPPAQALIMRLTPLSEVLSQQQLIFTVKVESLDADKLTMVLTVDEELKGKAPFKRLPINLKGDREAEKDKQVPQLLKRLAVKLPLVVFAEGRGNRYTAFCYTNGTWFQMTGTKDDDKVRWALTHAEPYLRRTFKGTTEELRQVVVDGLADKKKPPEPNPKEEPGLGPEVTPEPKPQEKDKNKAPGEVFGTRGGGQQGSGLAPGGPVFAVIPTVLVGGPLAILAVLFPTVFGGLLLFFRRWLVAFSLAGLNSTLYLLHAWLAGWLRGTWWGTWWGTESALWVTMTLVTALGILWSWKRHLAFAQAEQGALAAPTRSEHIALWVLTLIGVATVLVGRWLGASLLDAEWATWLMLFIGFWTGTAWTVWLAWVARRSPTGAPSLPAESVTLTAMVIACVLLGLATPAPSVGAAGEVVLGSDTGSANGKRALKVAWVFEAKERGVFYSSPIIDGDRVYIAAAHQAGFSVFGTLYCLDRSTGKQIWAFDDDGGLKQVFSTPTVAGGKLYVGEGFHQDRDCKLYCIDAKTGKKEWEFITRSHTESSPCVAGGNVYFGAGDDGVYCLDARGKEVWHYEGLHVDASPALVGDRLYVGSGVGDLYKETVVFCLKATTTNPRGEAVWRIPVDLPAWGSPEVSGEEVFFGLGNGNFLESDKKPAGAVLCVEAQTGKRQWRYDVPDGVLDRPAVDRERVYFGSRDGHCYCVDRREGQRLWKAELGSPVVAAPALARSLSGVVEGRDGSGYFPTTGVYAVAAAGIVGCLDPRTGKEEWRFDVASHSGALPELFSSPAVAVLRDGTGERRLIYFGAGLNNGQSKAAALYCYEESLQK
jgi:outer membrane protein assembly factor BamB